MLTNPNENATPLKY